MQTHYITVADVFYALEYEIPTFETIESFGSHIDAFHKLEDAEN